MSDTSATNKRIAKNTLMLYVRTFFTMTVSLFTSRVTLQTLGIEDYGIYNVVGGVITMFTFINNAMVSSTQRYLNFELATGNEEKLKSIFNTSLQIHVLISIIIILLGETVGLWFLMNKLMIPEARMTAAMWVYQCSILSCVVGIMSTPYNAAIIAHEKMSAFAYISILDVSLKLLIVYLLVISTYDKLIIYAILVLSIQLLIRYIYTRYCNKHFKETLFEWQINRPLLKEMAGFAGWSFWGNLSVVCYTQGLNMILNIFFGPLVNASRGIAVQIQGAVRNFVGGFQTALNPQITKSYASGDIHQMHNLIFRSARFSFLMLFFISLPIMLETKFILYLWLNTVPEDAVVFSRIILFITLIYTVANPLGIANQSTGNVKKYQAVEGGILLCILPVSYILLRFNFPAYSVFIVQLGIEIIAQFFRMYMLRNLIDLSLIQYCKRVYLPVLTTVILSIILPLIILNNMDKGLLRFIIICVTCYIPVGYIIFYIGLTNREREFVMQSIKRKITIIRKS